jgi:hypothetical protein
VALLLLLLKLLCHPSDAAACELRTVITYTKVQHHWHDLTRDDVGLCAAGASSRTSPSSTCAMAAVAIVSMHTHSPRHHHHHHHQQLQLVPVAAIGS